MNDAPNQCTPGKCGPDSSTIKKILVGVDGSENSLRAVRKAAEMALFFRGNVTLMHVISPSDSSYYMRDVTNSCDDEAKGTDKLCEAIKIMDEYRVLYETKVAVGHPAEAILITAEGEGEGQCFDLIVLGNRGINAVERFLIGSVSQRVVQHSKVPVLVVP